MPFIVLLQGKNVWNPYTKKGSCLDAPLPLSKLLKSVPNAEGLRRQRRFCGNGKVSRVDGRADTELTNCEDAIHTPLGSQGRRQTTKHVQLIVRERLGAKVTMVSARETLAERLPRDFLTDSRGVKDSRHLSFVSSPRPHHTSSNYSADADPAIKTPWRLVFIGCTPRPLVFDPTGTW